MEVFSRFEFLEDAAALFLVRFPGGGWGSVGHATSGRNRAMFRWYPWDRSEAVLVWNKTRCFPKTWHPRNSQKIPRQDVFFFKTLLKKQGVKESEWRKHICQLHGWGYVATYYIGIHVYMFENKSLYMSSELVLFWTRSVWNTPGNRN